jgi:hypothetical protein
MPVPSAGTREFSTQILTLRLLYSEARFVYFFICLFAVLGFELRASHLDRQAHYHFNHVPRPRGQILKQKIGNTHTHTHTGIPY